MTICPEMLWALAIDVRTYCGDIRRGHLAQLFGIDEPRLELAHTVLLFDQFTESFVAAGIVTSISTGIVHINVFHTWPVDTMTRHTMFRLVRPTTPLTDAPHRNTIPLPRAGLTRLAHSPKCVAYRAYAQALDDGWSVR